MGYVVIVKASRPAAVLEIRDVVPVGLHVLSSDALSHARVRA